jgi:L-seryl-tRNA(Ser) seleniumtransferase
MGELNQIPSVEELLQSIAFRDLIGSYGRPLVLRATREILKKIRDQFQSTKTIPETSEYQIRVRKILESWLAPTLIPVINATGVILHTNLGRAPLSKSARKAMDSLTEGYCTLEFDLERGERGNRSIHAEEQLRLLTGAESALVVNNNAAAVLLVLTVLAKRKRVIISRNQLVEIGGGFRIPEVMNESGAKLVEVGTTNRVHEADYEQALDVPAAAILRAHPSNFKIIGFTEEPTLGRLSEIAHKHGALLIDDLGSGALLDSVKYGLAHEPMVQESLADGADIVCFSGDKLLGGPQAGIILGKKVLLDKIKKHPLARALRADKLCLAGLSATLEHYLKDEAEREIPIWQMMARKTGQLKSKALQWRKEIGQGEVIASNSTIGGGSLPEEVLPTFVLAFTVDKPNTFLSKLRKSKTPIVARIENEKVIIDPRTVLPEQEEVLIIGIGEILH